MKSILEYDNSAILTIDCQVKCNTFLNYSKNLLKTSNGVL